MPRGINDFDTAELQGRNSANANSLSIVSPGLITDGLVLNLDAGNFVSYPAAGTTWFDVSNNRNNATLTNGPTYTTLNGGGIVFDGVDDYANVTETFGMRPAVMMIEVGFRINTFGAPGAQTAILFRQNTRSLTPRDAYMVYLDEGTSGLYVSTATSAGIPSGIGTTSALSTGTDYVATVVLNATTMSVYLNGQIEGSGSKAALNYSTTATLQVGRTNVSVGLDNFDGTIYFTRIYNRVFSPTEVEQNFNATRARFGL